MSAQDRFGQPHNETALQTVTMNPSYPGPSAGSDGQDQDDHILVHFNGHFNGQFRGAFMVPNNMQQQAPTESDAQIAARRAMSKRNSRSFAARITRNRSRKMEVARAGKPGITVDTSFARHRGNVPHQVYPKDSERRSGTSIRKQGWFGLGRSDTKNKGLGIVKGMTPQPGRASEDRERASKEPGTADSLTAGSKSWQDISPWDRPIPIGITVPSDSVTDFSPYRATRARSDSDTTLATPNIVVTPAAAMKSVWSPDTASDYTASSVYSRATHMPPWASDVPPVPVLPADVQNLPAHNGAQRDWNFNYPKRARGDTLESGDTAFEEEQDDIRKDRIMSTGTVFEEDETPLHAKKLQTLSVDTSTVPTPRRSQGWWNVITTPFVLSRTNSVWTQGGRNGEKTPDIPMVPAGYGTYRNSPSPSTYIWSATERSPSALGDLPLYPAQANFLANNAVDSSDRGHLNNVNASLVNSIDVNGHSAARTVDAPVNNPTVSAPKAMSVTSETALPLAHPTPIPRAASVSPDLTSKTSSPPAGTITNEAIAVGLPPHPQQAQPINVNIAFHDGRILANTHTLPAGTTTQIQPAHVIVPPLPTYADNTARSNTTPPQVAPVFFPPPPNAASKNKQFELGKFSRSSSPAASTHEAKLQKSKQHRKMNKIKSKFALCSRKKDDKKDEKKKKRSRFCLGCCCCLIVLILLAILIPLVVVFTRRHNSTSATPIAGNPDTGSDDSTQWLNNTNYPPMKVGILTIAQPEAVEEESGCVAPTTLWSCAVPKEQQKDIEPNKPDQPNFEVEVTFENGTAADLASPTRRAANPVSAGAFIRSLLRRASPSPSPAAPSTDEMKFLGQTTDGTSSPFEGESTPFFMSLKDPAASTSSTSRLARRADDPTNITLVIPPPSLNPDGTAAAAALLPFPSSQPLRLFNRGKSDEHYGFYTFFDRSIFLKSIDSSTGRGGNPADTDGGSTKDAATLRCTFTQTRFLVQIWTRSTQSLLNPAQNTTATAFKRPGTFPYPVTFTLDRHGGDVSKKNLFCYKMEKDGTIVDKEANKFFQFEDRSFGGNLVNGTQGRPNAKGPIDGGSGGCKCKWQNFQD